MRSFQKLFVNSTNRLSEIKNNIIISQPINNDILSNASQPKAPHLQTVKPSYDNILIPKRISGCSIPDMYSPVKQTYQQLQMQYNLLNKNLKEAQQEKQIMTSLFEKIFKIQQGSEEKLNKRFRRKKNQIQAKYACNVPECLKVYSSSTSLARHMKLKHLSRQFQPPQPFYDIPPQPNLGQGQECEGEIEDSYSEQSAILQAKKDECESNSLNKSTNGQISSTIERIQQLEDSFGLVRKRSANFNDQNILENLKELSKRIKLNENENSLIEEPRQAEPAKASQKTTQENDVQLKIEPKPKLT